MMVFAVTFGGRLGLFDLLLVLLLPLVVYSNLDQSLRNSSVCPSTETVTSFHGMLTLPKLRVPNKIAFRSCISRTQETVLADIEGPGCVKLFWLVTGMGASPTRPKRCVRTKDAMMMVLRIYYDDSPTPAVEAPLGAFFGIYHDHDDSWGNTFSGYGADNNLFKISENGAFTLVAPLPFAKRIRFTLINEDPRDIKMRLWSQISYDMYDPRCPFPEPLRFHASYRMEDRRQLKPQGQPHEFKRSYHIGHARGSGYLLGFTFGLTILDKRDAWFHNGAEVILLDPSTNPRVLKGTGGEDLFGTSCWFEKNHNFPDWGFMYGDNSNHFSAYRFFIDELQLPFASDFSFEYGVLQDFTQSVMYWYQHGPALVNSKRLPPLEQRLGEATSEDFTVPPPTGFVTEWNISYVFPLSELATSIGRIEAVDTSYRRLAPTFGFLSVGEYFFRFPTNEGYPKGCFVWARGHYVVKQAEQLSSMSLFVSHDDPLVLYINGQQAYAGLEVLSGYHTFRVNSSAMVVGQNEFLVQFSNTDNTNSRAFLFGLHLQHNNIYVHAQPNGRMANVVYFGDNVLQQRSKGNPAGEACE
eukprot:gene6874-7598_t